MNINKKTLYITEFFVLIALIGDSTGNRTRVTAVKGRCLDRLTMEPYKKPATSYFPRQLPAKYHQR